MLMKQNSEQNDFHQQVSKKERRKLKARREGQRSVWQGFGVFGLIGWSVSIPTVLFVLLGLWLDERSIGERSYTLTLLIAGLCLGCLNAWYWVSRKMEEIKGEEKEEPHDKHDA